MEACAWQGVGHGVGVSGHLLGGTIVIYYISYVTKGGGQWALGATTISALAGRKIVMKVEQMH